MQWCCRLIICTILIVPIMLTTVAHCAVVYADAAGRSVELVSSPRRIVSLVPSVTEIIYAIGAEAQLIGVTDFCTYPPDATTKQSIGSYASPSIEAVASLSPDLIIMGTSSASPLLLQQFEQLGVPVYIVSPHSLATTIDTIVALGKLTAHRSGAEALVEKLRQQMQTVRLQQSAHKVRILVCVMIQPLIVAGGGTLADDVIRVAGGINVAGQQPRYPTWGIEAVLAYDPELIIVSAHPGTPAPEDYFMQWLQLQAVRKKQIVNIDADLLQRPGPRLFDGLQVVAQHLHAIAYDKSMSKDLAQDGMCE